jgi:hypothetical protein
MRALIALVLLSDIACGVPGRADAPLVSPTPDAYLTLTNPARRGAAMTAILVTAPGSRCEIAVRYPGAPPSTDLIPKTVPERGQLQWIWIVAESTPRGNYPVDATCTLPSGRRTTARATLQVP